jgi:hypothetical protein
VLDGRELARPCNYALLRVLPPAGAADSDPQARPVVVVDPRAGHPVYFVTFRPEPEDGQTLSDVMDAELRFLEEVIARHPQSRARPMVVGNCQAGWATAILSPHRRPCRRALRRCPAGPELREHQPGQRLVVEVPPPVGRR